MKQSKRPSWDEYFMSLAQVVKSRSNCIRRMVGAVIEKEKRIIATGYSGTPSGVDNCYDGGCKRCAKRDKGVLEKGEEKHKCICIHAEQNAIIQSAYHGISTKDATMYITVSPCVQCAKTIINSGIKRIVCAGRHHEHEALGLLKKTRVIVEIQSNSN